MKITGRRSMGFLLLIAALVLGMVSFAVALTEQQRARLNEMQPQAIELFKKREYEKAIPLFKEILTMNPDDRLMSRYLAIAEEQRVEPYCRQAASAYQRKEYRAAVDQWQKIAAIHPDDDRIPRLLVLASDFIQIKSTEAMYELAQQLLQERKHDEAMNELQKILALRPGDVRARELMETAKQASSGGRVKVHYDAAEAYVKQGDFDRAIAEWNLVLKIDSRQDTASRLIASTVRKKLEAMYEKSKHLYETGDYSGSRDLYMKILEENPTDKDSKKIVERLNKLLNIVPKIDGIGRVWNLLRLSLSNHIAVDGNVIVSILSVRYAEQVEPDNTYVTLIRDFVEREHIDVVRSMPPPAMGMGVVDQYLLASLNNIYEARFDLAVQNANIVLALDSDNVMALKRLGSAYFAMGEKAKARQAWTKAFTLAPDDAELKQFISRVK